MTDSLKHQVLHSLKWVALGKITTQIFRWLITFWVIRLLLPEDYGVVAMADLLSSFLALFIGSLFAPAIIQAKEISKQMLKQMFALVLIVYFSIFAIQLSLADMIGAFYHSDDVASILKISAWWFLIGAILVIPEAQLARDMEFKRISIITAIANITAAFTTLAMAYLGYGFWAIIIGNLADIGVKAILVLAIKPLTYLPEFSVSVVKQQLKFGGLLTGLAIFSYIFLHMDVAIAGRYMSAVEIGLFAVGLQFALMPQKKLLPLLKQVAFPAFSKIQDQPERINAYILKAQKLSLLLTVPVFWGLASVVDLIIPIILGEKWIDAVLPTMIILLVMPLRFCEELFGPALKSQRKVKHMLINIGVMTIIMLVSILLGIEYGAVGLACAWAGGFPIAFVIVVIRNSRLFNIQPWHIAKLFIAPCLAGIAMLSSVYLLKQYLIDISVVSLISQIGVGGITYLLVLYMLDKNSVSEIRQLSGR